MIDASIKGLLTMTRLIVPGMVAHGRGYIVNIGSVAGDAVCANDSAYCATKTAVKVLSDGPKADLVSTTMRVTTVKLGLVQTDFSTAYFHGSRTRVDHAYDDIQPLTGDGIAGAVLYTA